MAAFNQTIRDIYQGGLLAELDEKLTEVVKAAEITGKIGSISLQLKIKAKGSSGQVEITPVIKAQIPEHERGVALMFATPEGNLQLTDPRQKDLDLKEIQPKPLKMAKQQAAV